MSMCLATPSLSNVVSIDGRVPDLIPASRMRTLFADTIRSPPLKDEPQADPNTLTFASSIQSSTAASPFSSNDSSYKTDGWLTKYVQNQAGPNGPTSYTHGEPTTLPARRRGNPKVLFMGMRRWIASYDPTQSGVAKIHNWQMRQILNTKSGVSEVLAGRYSLLGTNKSGRIRIHAVSSEGEPFEPL